MRAFLKRQAIGIERDRRLFGGWFHVGLVAFIVIAGAWLRAPSLDNPSHFSQPSPTRQYRAANFARGLYYSLRPPADEARRAAAERATERLGILEPPITEGFAATGYLIVGGETPVVPRLITSSLWLASGLVLYLLARILFQPDAALVALGYHVLSPFSVIASRSFQPEALMVLCIVLALFFIVRHHRAPGTRSLLSAALASALAILVKPVAVFFTAFAFGFLALGREGVRRALSNRANWVYLAVGVGLPGAFYVLSAFFGDSMSQQAEMTFVPARALTARFWSDWLAMVSETHGTVAALLGLVGVALAPAGTARTFLISSWLAYVVYGIVFTYHTATHRYYQVPLFPILALSLGALAAAALRLVPRRVAPGVAVLVAALVVVSLHQTSEKSARVLAKRFDRQIVMYRAIGRAVRHSARVVFLSPEAWGGAIQFHGELSGWYWQGGERQRLEDLRELIKVEGAEYFVATDLDELKRQRSLSTYLDRNCRVVENARRYVVYDLRRRPKR